MINENKILNKEGAAPQGIGIAGFLTDPGNKDVTTLVSGIARFLAERTKEELNEAFFQKMKEKLNAYPELTTTFPKTASFLNAIETYSYASVLQVPKEAFETDMQPGQKYIYCL